MKEKYTQAELNGRCFFRTEVWQGMQNRIVLAPSRAALFCMFLCLHFIYLCSSCEFVALFQGRAEPAWQRVEGTCDAHWQGNQKLSSDSRITM